MRRVCPRFAAGVTAVLPLLVLASACSREGASRVAAPSRPEPPQVTAARWVWEPQTLAGAVQSAERSPLTQRALSQAPIAGRLRARYDLAVRAVGQGADGKTLGLTILPHSVEGDPTRAVFISVADGLGSQAAELAEMIAGREPAPDEVGFHSVVWGDRVVWVRSGDVYEMSGAGALRSPMKRNWGKLFTCLADRMPTGCAAGAAIARDLAPSFPQASAIGCGVGAAAGALTCAAEFLGK